MNFEFSLEAWVKNQQGRLNHLDHKRLCEGYMYQSFGEDIDFLNKNFETLKPFLWTVFFSKGFEEDGPWKIIPGFHITEGRAGYLLAGIEWKRLDSTYYY